MNAALSQSIAQRHGPSAILARLIADAIDSLDGDLDRVRSSLSCAVALVDSTAGDGLPRGGLAAWQTRKLAALIETNLEAGMRITDLAASVRFSRSHFTRAFKEHFGCCPQQYILEQRVSRAQRLMLTPDCRLCDVAQACGFSDQAHLSRMFRRLVGATPNAWRRSQLAY